VIPDHLDSLRLRFIERCRGELRSLRDIRDAPLPESEGTPGDTLVRTVHGLAGAGATFGFPEVSRRAGDLETLLLEKNSPDVDRRRALDHLIATLEALTGPAAQPGTPTNP
jgi:HPt (histidine-containing phosphotransfer) domain-containing protein